MSKKPDPASPLPVSRRAMLRRTACGFGAVALQGLFADLCDLQGAQALGPLAERPPHLAPRAKRVIFLFMHGGVSHIDSFDPKPRLDLDHGKPIPFKRELSFADSNLGGLTKAFWKFKRYGESGIPVSDLFPHVGGCVDDLCVLRSMVGDGIDHGSAMLQLHTGTFSFTRPSLGSWVLQGLGTESQNLPGFVMIKPTLWHGGDKLWNSSFLPGHCHGTPIGRSTTSIDELSESPIEYLSSARLSNEAQRYELEMLRKINARHQRERIHQPELEARIQSFELAFRMQAEASEAFDVEAESDVTKKLYGYDEKVTRSFAWQCMLARRLAERGVRFVQCNHSGAEEKWDHHSGIFKGHARSAREIDKPIAGLLKDLKSRGLLDETLVVWAGEFGRTPYSQEDGRDHNPYGFTIWLAGAGVRAGTTYGATDEFGYHAVENRVHIHDLHATLLHLLGLDHERLTYRYAGRDFRLTDEVGQVVQGILA